MIDGASASRDALAMAKHWSLTKTQLKPLSDAGLLLFALRNSRRSALWWRDADRKKLDEAEGFVCSVANGGEPTKADLARSLVRAARDASAARINAAKGREEALARAAGLAIYTVEAAVEAANAPDRAARAKAVIDGAKYCASLVISLAHAGLVRERPAQGDVVSLVGDAVWAVIHRDIALVAVSGGALATVNEVEAMGALWDGEPSWASPDRAGEAQ